MNNSKGFGMIGSLFSHSKIAAMKAAILSSEGQRAAADFDQKLREKAAQMRLNLSNPNSYKKVLAALSK